MYIPYYNAIRTLIENASNMPFQHVDYFNDQYRRYQELKQKTFPHLFIEFPGEIQWDELGNKAQMAENVNILFHIVAYDVKDDPSIAMELANWLHQTINQQALVDSNRQLSTSFVRLGTELVVKYDQLKVFKIRYSTSLYDESFMDELVEVDDVTPIVEGSY